MVARLLKPARAAARSALVLAVLVAGTWSCERRRPAPPPKAPPESIRAFLPQADMLRGRRDSLERALAIIPARALAARLRGDSRVGLEPFNSPTYREVLRRGGAIAESLALPPARAESLSFLELLALRELRGSAYAKLSADLRARILVESLRSARTFNAWGLPHAYSESGADATVELGRAARPYLLRLLGDTREAPLWGSEEAAESARYRYRVKDYAWWLLLRIDRREVTIPVDPAQRDSLIRAYAH